LSSERSFGSGAIGPIPWSSIVRYGERQGLTPDAIDDLLVPVVRSMDRAYVEWQRQRQARKARAQAPDPKETL
jgi:hypothetical protein